MQTLFKRVFYHFRSFYTENFRETVSARRDVLKALLCVNFAHGDAVTRQTFNFLTGYDDFASTVATKKHFTLLT